MRAQYVPLLVILLPGLACSRLRPDEVSSSQLEQRQDSGEVAVPARYGFGKPASAERIAEWDIDVRPDGTGLPAGAGTAVRGRTIYAEKCAPCHGATGVEGPNDRLVGRVPGDSFPFGEDLTTWDAKTIGGYWPYATTLYDYINRAMPQTAPGSLSPDEVYAVTAFLLHLNGLVGEDAVMNAETLPAIEMPARDRFVPDDRPDFLEVR